MGEANDNAAPADDQLHDNNEQVSTCQTTIALSAANFSIVWCISDAQKKHLPSNKMLLLDWCHQSASLTHLLSLCCFASWSVEVLAMRCQ